MTKSFIESKLGCSHSFSVGFLELAEHSCQSTKPNLISRLHSTILNYLNKIAVCTTLKTHRFLGNQKLFFNRVYMILNVRLSVLFFSFHSELSN